MSEQPTRFHGRIVARLEDKIVAQSARIEELEGVVAAVSANVTVAIQHDYESVEDVDVPVQIRLSPDEARAALAAAENHNEKENDHGD